jgi:putative membrane protein
MMRPSIGRAGAAWAGATAVLIIGAIIVLSHELGPQARHMGLHIVSMNVVAPVLAALLVGYWAGRDARPSWLWLAALVQIAALWAAHAPALQPLVMTSRGFGLAVHGILLLVAISFWTILLSLPDARRWHAIPALLLTGKLACLLAVLMVFAPRTLYARHGHDPALPELADQHLAGLLMIAACPLSYLIAAIVITVQLVCRDPHGASFRQPARSVG